MTTKRLYGEAEKNNIRIYDWNDGEQKAATLEYCNNYCIFLNRKKILSESEERCVLAHEIGHCKTGSTHRLFSQYDIIEKHEHKADKYAVSKLLPKRALCVAMKKGCTELWQLAEHFNLQEEFIHKALLIYGLIN